MELYRTVDNTVDLYVAKPDIRPKNAIFFAYPTCIRRPR